MVKIRRKNGINVRALEKYVMELNLLEHNSMSHYSLNGKIELDNPNFSDIP